MIRPAALALTALFFSALVATPAYSTGEKAIAEVGANLEDAEARVKAAVNALKAPPAKAFNFAYGGSGFLLLYQLGVSAALADHRVYTEATRFAGISGGSVVTTLVATGVSMTEAGITILQKIFEALAELKPKSAAPPPGVLSKLLAGVLNAVKNGGETFGVKHHDDIETLSGRGSHCWRK